MNTAPRSYLTPADRDAAMIEASKLRAMSLRREAIDAAWLAIVHAVQKLLNAGQRSNPVKARRRQT